MIFHKLSRIIFFTGLFLLSLLFIPTNINGFEGTKVQFFQIWTIVLVVLTSLWLVTYGGTSRRNRILPIVVFVYFFWMFFASLVGADPAASFYGLFWRGQGIITQACYVGLVFVVVNILTNKDKKTLAAVLISSGFSLCMFVVLGILANRFFDWPVYRYLERFPGTMGNPNFLAGVLSIIFPLIFGLRSKLMKIFLAGIFLATIFLSGSRGAFLALGVVCGFLLWLRVFEKSRGLAIVIAAMTTLAFFVWFVPWVNKIPWTNPSFAASRQRMWVRGYRAFSEKPVVGYGLENFSLAISKIVYPDKMGELGEVFIDKAHNETLENLVAGGVPALILWGTIVFLAGRNYFLKKNYLFLAALVIFVVKAQTNVVSVSEYALFWVLVGFSGANDKSNV